MANTAVTDVDDSTESDSKIRETSITRQQLPNTPSLSPPTKHSHSESNEIIILIGLHNFYFSILRSEE